MSTHPSPLALFAFTCAALSAAILFAHLVRRPALRASTRVWLLLGLGVFPIGAAMAGNVAGYEATKQRTFCGSCHVMVPHASDSNDAASMSLAARHARNKLFGEENCYVCHADYGMFGTVTTKLGGLKHVWHYYTEFKDVPLDEAKRRIHLYKPFSNDACMQCHSTQLEVWTAVPDHKSSLEDVRAGAVSCASAGCHGYAHPFTKEDAGAKPARASSGDREAAAAGARADAQEGDAGR